MCSQEMVAICRGEGTRNRGERSVLGPRGKAGLDGTLLACVIAAVIGVAAPVALSHASGPKAHAAATCSQYPNQAAAQDVGDTNDADHDGIYCESLPCPCSTAPPHSSAQPPAPGTTSTQTIAGGTTRDVASTTDPGRPRRP